MGARPECPKCHKPARRLYGQIQSRTTGRSTTVTVPAVFCGTFETDVVGDHEVGVFRNDGHGVVTMNAATVAKNVHASQLEAIKRMPVAKVHKVGDRTWGGAKAALAAAAREEAKTEAARREKAAEVKAAKEAKAEERAAKAATSKKAKGKGKKAAPSKKAAPKARARKAAPDATVS